MKIIIRENYKKDIFVSIFNIIKNNTSLVNINFNNNNIYIQGMDTSHIVLFNFYIKKEWFSEYDIANFESGENVCIDTTMFYNIINNVSKNQSIIITNVEKNPKDNTTFIRNDYLYINLINEDFKLKESVEFDKYYKLQLNETDYELMDIPTDYEFDCDFLISSKKIVEITNQLLNFNNEICIECSEECIEFKTIGITGEMNVKIPTDDLHEFSIENNTKLTLKYSLQFINKYCLTKNLSDKIYFYLSSNYPLKIKYDLGEEIDISFYIAPKVDL